MRETLNWKSIRFAHFILNISDDILRNHSYWEETDTPVSFPSVSLWQAIAFALELNDLGCWRLQLKSDSTVDILYPAWPLNMECDREYQIS